MRTRTTTDVVYPKRLAPTALQHLVEELYRVHCQVFYDDKESFVKLFMQPQAAYTALRLRSRCHRIYRQLCRPAPV